MSEDPFLNPINPEKVAQNPGLLPYAHTAGSAVIKPEDMGKSKATVAFSRFVSKLAPPIKTPLALEKMACTCMFEFNIVAH